MPDVVLGVVTQLVGVAIAAIAIGAIADAGTVALTDMASRDGDDLRARARRCGGPCQGPSPAPAGFAALQERSKRTIAGEPARHRGRCGRLSH